MITALEAPTLSEIEDARTRIDDLILQTPLIPLAIDRSDGGGEIWLKLENLQPIGSFKLRGIGNAMRRIPADDLQEGVYAASAGNMGQALAWAAREMNVPCTVVVPEHAPRTKVDAMKRLGAEIVYAPFEQWWEAIRTHNYDGIPGRFIHPVADRDVIAGNGTIGLELLEQLDTFDAVIVPYGGGGLSSGIAAALRGNGWQGPVYAAEVSTAAPLAAAWRVGGPVTIERTSSFIDGIGGGSVLDQMWPLVRDLLAGSITVTPEQVADVVAKLVERHHVVAEGAGAAGVAAALTGNAGPGRIVCIVTGGNLDLTTLATILTGSTPSPSARGPG